MMDSVDDTTLMQKWRAHWNTRDRIFNPSPQMANKMGVTLFWASNITLMYTTLYVTAVRDDDAPFGVPGYWWRVTAWFMWFQTSFNWFLASLKVLSQTTGERIKRAFDKRGIVAPSSQDDKNHEHDRPQHQQLAEFETCPVCLLLAPPRSHHCKICNCCVLKLDHHCFFTASCVGFNNQRYFVVLMFYTTVSCALASLLLARHLGDGLTISVWYDLLLLTPPFAVIQWFSGDITGYQLLQLLELCIIIIYSLTALHFLLWQVNIVTRGQTSHEAHKSINRYRLDISSNLKTVFGPYWILNFLWPLRTLPDGDGIFWQTQKIVKGS